MCSIGGSPSLTVELQTWQRFCVFDLGPNSLLRLDMDQGELSFCVQNTDSQAEINKLCNYLGLEGPDGLGVQKSDFAAQELQNGPGSDDFVFAHPSGLKSSAESSPTLETKEDEDEDTSSFNTEDGPPVNSRISPSKPQQHTGAESPADVEIDTEPNLSEIIKQIEAVRTSNCRKEEELITATSHHRVLLPKKRSWSSWSKGAMLGSGSFGAVYEGVGNDGMFFAVKEVQLSDQGKNAKEAILQLEQEIALLSDLQHINIVQYLGTERKEDKLCIFLELVSRGSLASVYKQYHLITDQIRAYTKQILCGLKYLHHRNIIHRDIKCANILVDTKGVVKLADFGMAKEVDQLDILKSCKGSAYWMAPEVIDPVRTYNHAADIWSVGCTVLEMATGKPPFGELEWFRALWKVGHGEVPPIPEELPADLRDFISKCLEGDPAKRPNCDELLTHPFITETSLSLPDLPTPIVEKRSSDSLLTLLPSTVQLPPRKRGRICLFHFRVGCNVQVKASTV